MGVERILLWILLWSNVLLCLFILGFLCYNPLKCLEWMLIWWGRLGI